MEFPIYQLSQEKIEELFTVVPDKPKSMYVRGTLPHDQMILLSVVGARKLTRYGEDVTKHLISSLRGLPVCIISGLAMGIDSIALSAGIEAGLHTVAIPGSGIDDRVLIPRSNLLLAQNILVAGGAIMSEWEPMTTSQIWTFPMRNRLMAGMADAVLVIEAENKSGTRITAKLATDYNVDVLSVPGNIFSSTSSGTNNLIREGATPIGSVEDLHQALGFEKSSLSEEEHDFTPIEKKIWDIVATPTTRDDLIRTLELPAHEVSMTLSIMEIKGLVQEVYGEIRRN